jgi:hypothetical protein
MSGDTFMERITVIDEWDNSHERFRLINKGAGPDELQVRDGLSGDSAWRRESSQYVHGVLCNRIAILAALSR